ncbi:MAG: RluA family pseudouridine synthase [Gammaproteobacteria bacterium]|nr:RluA family pseudouridine synthase [Gammaproteobacteria bacterium]
MRAPNQESERGAAPRAEIIEVAPEQAGQRIDNFLIARCKGVPKTRLYRALRGGEVRVNGARKKPPYQLRAGDKLRIPPLRRAAPATPPPRDAAEHVATLFEDECMLVVDKPAGLAAHGGSGMRYGLIEALRARHEDAAHLELAHRLDRETSGCLMLAKSRAALLDLQAQLAARRVGKDYAALVRGVWRGGAREIDAPLRRRPGAKALDARSVFAPRRQFLNCALVGVALLSGRMHQARAHAAAAGHPIAGDRRYGDRAFNREMRAAGLRRMFLHAESLRFAHPLSGMPVEVRAELPAELQAVVEALRGAPK